jgi:SAM-dependent methyltransferase
MQSLPVIADVGSGVTFFPFSVAKMGAIVICCDIDPICEADYSKAIPLFPLEKGCVSFRLIKRKSLPYNDAEVDIIYCISVIEHLLPEEWPGLLDEFCRVLKPTGSIILTVDLDLRGDSELSAHNYYELHRQIDLRFTYEESPRSVHPANMLTSAAGPYALRSSFRQMLKRRLKGAFKKSPLPGPHDAIPFYLAVEGSVYTCRSGGIACP